MDAQAEMGVPVEDGFRDFFGAQDRDTRGDARMLRPHQRERVGDQIVAETFDGCDLDMAGVDALQRAELGMHALGVGQHRIDVAGEHLAGRRHLEAGRRALEQRRAEPASRLRICRLTAEDATFSSASRAADRARAPHRIEVVNGGGVDAVIATDAPELVGRCRNGSAPFQFIFRHDLPLLLRRRRRLRIVVRPAGAVRGGAC